MVSQSTKDRLLEAAMAVFAEKGFGQATLAEITERAGTNIAAVNYHFGNKSAFYATVVAHHIRRMTGPLPEHDTELPAERRLADFVAWIIRKMTACGTESSVMELQRQEMAQPSPLLDKIVQTMIKPEISLLESIIRELLPPGAPDDVVRRHVLSVMGQCTMYRHARPVIERLYPEMVMDDAEAERLAAHITAVTLAAIDAETDKTDPR